MPRYRVHLTCMVVAYSAITVEADDGDHALAIVRTDIDENEWDSAAWQAGETWEPNWSEAEDLSAMAAEEVS